MVYDADGQDIPENERLSKLRAACDFAIKKLLASPRISKFTEYFGFESYVDDECNCSFVILNPTDAFWELDFDDEKYAYEKISKESMNIRNDTLSQEYIDKNI